MKRKDLKSGHILEFEDGKFGLVVNTSNGYFIQFNESYANMSYINENLEKKGNNVIRIREVVFGMDIIRKCMKYAKIIWERKEIKEMTLEEISNALGYEVKVVK